MSSILETAMTATIAGCIIVGAYQVGKLSERQRWRLELAAGDAKLQKQVNEASVDVVSVDQQLIEEFRDARARAAEAAEIIAKHGNAPATPIMAAGANSCGPVSAHCLRR